MRLASFAGSNAVVRLGALSETGLVDLRTAARNLGVASDTFADMLFFLAAGESAAAEARRLVKETPPGAVVAMAGIRWLPPIPRPGKIIAIGLNYRDHQIESGAKEMPKAPMIFAKFTSSIAAAEQAIIIPAGDPQVDYEAELAVVIGKRGKAISEAKALDYVAGYMPLNDVSARAWQFADKQWVRGKSCDTFCPTGPYLTTSDEIADPQNLAIRTRVNGSTLQDSHTSRMIFKVPQLIAHISASITLEPGDIIATGTPEGVGAFRNPPIFLKAGDVVEVEIEKLGVLRNPVVAA
jgi:2-keto-4-pentenoate hydratase/2-oxohepta-3-ene-1,7-dioic acid hydratase in catechol pathway